MHPFTAHPSASVSALGEGRLIAAIQRWLGPATLRTPFGIGDDCAVLPASVHRQLVTVDPVVYGEHFDDSIAPAAAGSKLLKRNLSDIAAMGGRPRAAVIALALDRRVRLDWLEQFYRGLAREARRYRVPIVGGDVTRQAGGLAATLTLIGDAPAGRPVTRRGARSGDWIYVTGELGGSILGRHHRFSPRLAEGRWLAERAEVRSLMDVSDGLARDLAALLPAGTRPHLQAAAIPISAAARTLARRSGRPALDHALGDGEDYELLFTVSARADRAAFERAWSRRFRTRLSALGRFAPINAPLPAGTIDLRAHRGYEHLTSP